MLFSLVRGRLQKEIARALARPIDRFRREPWMEFLSSVIFFLRLSWWC